MKQKGEKTVCESDLLPGSVLGTVNGTDPRSKDRDTLSFLPKDYLCLRVPASDTAPVDPYSDHTRLTVLV